MKRLNFALATLEKKTNELIMTAYTATGTLLYPEVEYGNVEIMSASATLLSTLDSIQNIVIMLLQLNC